MRAGKGAAAYPPGPASATGAAVQHEHEVAALVRGATAAPAVGAARAASPPQGKTHATAEGEDRQAPRAQGAACLWLPRSRPDQVRIAPLPGTRRSPPSAVAAMIWRRG